MEEGSLNRAFASEAEAAEILKVREAIEPHIGDSCRDDDVLGDLRLLRFLRGHGPEKVVGVVTAYLVWRRDNGVDAIRESVIHRPYDQVVWGGDRRALRFVRANYDCGTTKAGDLIQVDRMGLSDPAGLLALFDGDPEAVLKLQIGHMEYMAWRVNTMSREQGRLVKVYSLVDAAGLSMSHMLGPVRQFAKRITKVAQLNYCEHSARINIVHAPTVFKAIFAVVQPLINKRTLAKFRITGADCGFLKEDCDDAVIPELYGGTLPELSGVFPLVGAIDDRKDYATLVVASGGSNEVAQAVEAGARVSWVIDFGGYCLDLEVRFQSDTCSGNSVKLSSAAPFSDICTGDHTPPGAGKIVLVFNNRGGFFVGAREAKVQFTVRRP